MTTAASCRAAAPTPVELIAGLAPWSPRSAHWPEETERNRTISPRIIARIRDADLLRTCRPKEFGGFEYDAVVALEIALVISAACASTGWTMNGALSNGISFGHFPIEAQRELWGGGEDPFTCACFAPTGTAFPAEGVYAERQMVVRERLRSFELDQARRVDHASPTRRAQVEACTGLDAGRRARRQLGIAG
ncbi:MAG: hypothetical protein JOZ58_16740, partial [Acetobacteraceae bacterium]|nr:hypothetical protein [Acetobacteraceae bacterium]